MRLIVFVSLAVAAVALVTYLCTLAPTIAPGDSGDIVTAAAVFGVAHPPGYPLQTLLGHLFTFLPFGSPAYRVNLMSAVFSALGVALVAIASILSVSACTRDSWHRPWSAAMAGVSGGLMLAFSLQYWMYAVIAEVFALNNFFAAALIVLAMAWYQRPADRRLLWAFALMSGLAATNQQTIVLLAPGLAVLLVAAIRRRWKATGQRPSLIREIGVAVCFLLLGLTPYLLLPLAASRDPVLNWGNPVTLDAFLQLVTRAQYGSGQLVAGGAHGSAVENLGLFARYLTEAFTPIGVGLAAIGLGWTIRRRPALGAALGLCFFVAGPAFLAFANPPTPEGLMRGIIARFYMLPSVPFAILLGAGAGAVAQTVLRRVPEGRSVRRVATASLALVLLLPAWTFAASLPTADQHDNRLTLELTTDLLAPLDQNAILLAVGDTAILAPWYVQHAEGFRPDVTVIAVPLLTSHWYIDQLRRQHPDIQIPFDLYDPPSGADTGKLVDANIGRRPVYYVGVITDRFPANYDEMRVGFARKFVPKGTAPDPFAYARDHLPTLEAFHYPTRTFESWTWEAWESAIYGAQAFDVANALETIDESQAATWYRRAIELAPASAGAYKNLAILLDRSGGDHQEVGRLLVRFLELAPNDPEAPKIREYLSGLPAATP